MSDEIGRIWEALIEDAIENAPEPEDLPSVNLGDDGDPRCAGGCGYPVAFYGDLCGECACEDDGAIY